MSKVFKNKMRVRYGETDKMGYVYYGNYALYLEVARTELIRSLGLSYQEMENNGIQLPVVNLNLNYRKAAKYDDELYLETTVQGEISKKVTFQTKINNSEGNLICTGKVELIFMDANTNKVISCPKDFKELLKTYQWL